MKIQDIERHNISIAAQIDGAFAPLDKFTANICRLSDHFVEVASAVRIARSIIPADDMRRAAVDSCFEIFADSFQRSNPALKGNPNEVFMAGRAACASLKNPSSLEWMGQHATVSKERRKTLAFFMSSLLYFFDDGYETHARFHEFSQVQIDVPKGNVSPMPHNIRGEFQKMAALTQRVYEGLPAEPNRDALRPVFKSLVTEFKHSNRKLIAA